MNKTIFVLSFFCHVICVFLFFNGGDWQFTAYLTVITTLWAIGAGIENNHNQHL